MQASSCALFHSSYYFIPSREYHEYVINIYPVYNVKCYCGAFCATNSSLFIRLRTNEAVTSVSNISKSFYYDTDSHHLFFIQVKFPYSTTLSTLPVYVLPVYVLMEYGS